MPLGHAHGGLFVGYVAHNHKPCKCFPQTPTPPPKSRLLPPILFPMGSFWVHICLMGVILITWQDCNSYIPIIWTINLKSSWFNNLSIYIFPMSLSFFKEEFVNFPMPWNTPWCTKFQHSFGICYHHKKFNTIDHHHNNALIFGLWFYFSLSNFLSFHNENNINNFVFETFFGTKIFFFVYFFFLQGSTFPKDVVERTKG